MRENPHRPTHLWAQRFEVWFWRSPISVCRRVKQSRSWAKIVRNGSLPISRPWCADLSSSSGKTNPSFAKHSIRRPPAVSSRRSSCRIVTGSHQRLAEPHQPFRPQKFSPRCGRKRAGQPPEARSVNVFQRVKVDRAFVAARYKAESAKIYAADAQGEGH